MGAILWDMIQQNLPNHKTLNNQNDINAEQWEFKSDIIMIISGSL